MQQQYADIFNGNIRTDQIGDAITLRCSDFSVLEDCTLEETHPTDEFFQLGFCLEGDLQWEYPGLNIRALSLSDNESHVQLGTVESSLSNLIGGQKYRGVSVTLDPGRFENLVSCFRCSNVLMDLRRNHRQSAYAITPHVSLILQQIDTCSICESLRATYLEGKILELIAVYFDEVVCQTDVSEKDSSLSNEDSARLMLVKTIIDKRFAHPLSISELARDTCLNEYKLKRGFKQRFDSTILEYIISKRMEMAQVLLEDGRHMVKDIAWMVGYSKPSNFIDAFKKHYGTTPGEVLRS
jgi:AraC-like DNA-binding protein